MPGSPCAEVLSSAPQMVPRDARRLYPAAAFFAAEAIEAYAGEPLVDPAGQVIGPSDISNGALVFTPAANANANNYASFTFQVQDNGGTANSGVDLDQTPNTIRSTSRR